MKKLLFAVGPGPRVIVTILGVLVAGMLALGLLFLVAGELSAFFGALMLAIVGAVPMLIVYLVARVLRKETPAVAPPPPATGFPQYPVAEQPLRNPDDLR